MVHRCRRLTSFAVLTAVVLAVPSMSAAQGFLPHEQSMTILPS